MHGPWPFLLGMTVSPGRTSNALSAATVRYFGFGANVDQELMRRRIGSVPLSAEPAVVRGHRLAFTATPGPGLPGVGSLEPSYGQSECHGMLYTLSAAQMVRLCASEGLPVAYSLVSVPCIPYAGGGRVGASTLRAKGYGTLIESALGPIRPSERYIGVIRAGARASGLRDTWIEYLDSIVPYGQ